MFNKKTKNKYYILILSFIFLGFFVSVFHLIPEIHHQADSHTGHEKLIGVDHQPFLLSAHDNLNKVSHTILNYQENIFFDIILDQVNSSLIYTDIGDPPDKISLYIKNNTLLI